MKLLIKLGRNTYCFTTVLMIILLLILSNRCYSQSNTVPEIDVNIGKEASFFFMAKNWKWPSVKQWDGMLKERIAQALTVTGYSDAKKHLKLTTKPKFGWVTMLTFNSTGEVNGVPLPRTGSGYKIKYAEVYLKGKLVAEDDTEPLVSFSATRILFSQDEDFIAALFDSAVMDIVSQLALSGGNKEKSLKWIWERRDRIQQGAMYRHIEPNPKAKAHGPDEVIFEVVQPGPTLWNVLLRVRSRSSLDKVLSEAKSSEVNIQIAIAQAFKQASSEPKLKTFMRHYVSDIKKATDDFQGDAKKKMDEAIKKIESSK